MGDRGGRRKPVRTSRHILANPSLPRARLTKNPRLWCRVLTFRERVPSPPWRSPSTRSSAVIASRLWGGSRWNAPISSSPIRPAILRSAAAPAPKPAPGRCFNEYWDKIESLADYGKFTRNWLTRRRTHSNRHPAATTAREPAPGGRVKGRHRAGICHRPALLPRPEGLGLQIIPCGRPPPHADLVILQSALKRHQKEDQTERRKFESGQNMSRRPWHRRSPPKPSRKRYPSQAKAHISRSPRLTALLIEPCFQLPNADPVQKCRCRKIEAPVLMKPKTPASP
jgi:hypothetical protein